MVSIAEPIAKPVSRFRFILDRRDVLGAVFVAPAILYVLLLVGLPLLLSVYYSVSAYTIYDPSWRFVGLANFAQIVENPDFLANAEQHLYLHVRIAIPRPRAWQVRCVVAVATVPGAQDRQGAGHITLGGADRARHRRLAMDVRLALQRHQLVDDRARRHRPFRRAELARQPASGDVVRDCRAMPGVSFRSRS